MAQFTNLVARIEERENIVKLEPGAEKISQAGPHYIYLTSY